VVGSEGCANSVKAVSANIDAAILIFMVLWAVDLLIF
jgi:hypothetical protein